MSGDPESAAAAPVPTVPGTQVVPAAVAAAAEPSQGSPQMMDGDLEQEEPEKTFG